MLLAQGKDASLFIISTWLVGWLVGFKRASTVKNVFKISGETGETKKIHIYRGVLFVERYKEEKQRPPLSFGQTTLKHAKEVLFPWWWIGWHDTQINIHTESLWRTYSSVAWPISYYYFCTSQSRNKSTNLYKNEGIYFIEHTCMLHCSPHHHRKISC